MKISQIFYSMFIIGILLITIGVLALPKVQKPSKIKGSKVIEGKGVKITIVMTRSTFYIHREMNFTTLGLVGKKYCIEIRERIIGPDGNEVYNSLSTLWGVISEHDGSGTSYCGGGSDFIPGKYKYVFEMYLIPLEIGDKIVEKELERFGNTNPKDAYEHTKEVHQMMMDALSKGTLLVRCCAECVIEERATYYSADNWLTRIGLAMILPIPLVLLDKDESDKKKKVLLLVATFIILLIGYVVNIPSVLA